MSTQTAERVKASELAPGDVCSWAWLKGSMTTVKVASVDGERVNVTHATGSAQVYASSLRGPVVKAQVAKPVVKSNAKPKAKATKTKAAKPAA